MAKSGKGSAFEREVCGMLSHWWTGDPNASVVWRTAQSGGRATVRGRKGKKTSGHCGDLCATDECIRPFFDLITVELKRGYPRATIHDLLDKPGKAALQTYEEWIEQAKQSAANAGVPHWLIIHKRDRRVALVMMSEVLMRQLNDEDGRADWCYSTVQTGKIDGGLVVLPLEHFLSLVTPDVIRKAAKRLKRAG